MIFSIDVEDWSQSVLNRHNPVTQRVADSTHTVLDILSEHNVKGTFFTLANVAQTHPEMVRRIVSDGHELASHGMAHENLYKMTPAELIEDVHQSVDILEQIAGSKVIGYRAPNFSVRENMFEPYCEALASAGIRYDSSLFPMAVKKYGIEAKYDLAVFKQYNINEYYLTHINIGGKELPFFGGGYFRLAPYAMTKYFTRQMSDDAVFYMHPYEVDTGEYHALLSDQHHIPAKWQITQFVNRSTVPEKLARLFRDFEFTSFADRYYSNIDNKHSERTSDTLLAAY